MPVTVTNDEIYEPDPEEFYVDLTGASNARISNEHNQATCTIYDDDNPPEVSISGDQECVEPSGGTRTLIFTISLSQPCQEEVTVTWQTQEAWWSSRVPATAGEDYESASGSVVFAPYRGLVAA